MDPLFRTGDKLKHRYLIDGEMRPGGFAKVYLALDTHLQNRKVVVKTMEGRQVRLDDPWFKEHFDNEIKALVRVRHPGVVGVLDVGETATLIPYFIMPFVEGENLRAAMSKGRMNLLRAGRIIEQLSFALSAAHHEGITHRDIKPENVLLQNFMSGQESVVLIDFGISTFKDLQNIDPTKLTRVAGTMPYIAPEQMRGRPEFASDTWSLGVLAFELVTSQVPFSATNEVELAEQQVAGPFAPPQELRPDLPVAAQEVILRALSINVTDRYPSIHEMGQAFLRAVTETEVGPPNFDPNPESVAPPREADAVPPFNEHVVFVGLANRPRASLLEHQKTISGLTDVVRETPSYQSAHSRREVVSTELTDAIALIFSDSLAAVNCAVEIARATRKQALRIGIHTGPVERGLDVNDREIFSGSGFDYAEAVMDCGDSGHILISSSTADHVVGIGGWEQYFRDLGEHEVKQKVVLRLYSLWTQEVGSPTWPQKLVKRSPDNQLSLPELLSQCRTLFETLDEFLTPAALRILFRTEQLNKYLECVPRSSSLDLDHLVDCLHRRGRHYRGEALIELLDHLTASYKADYRGMELETLKDNLKALLTNNS